VQIGQSSYHMLRTVRCLWHVTRRHTSPVRNSSQMTGVERKWGQKGKITGRLALEGHPMKWSIRLELTPDGNPPITFDIGMITRPIAD
jgi:hypothetical protein